MAEENNGAVMSFNNSFEPWLNWIMDHLLPGLIKGTIIVALFAEGARRRIKKGDRE